MQRSGEEKRQDDLSMVWEDDRQSSVGAYSEQGQMAGEMGYGELDDFMRSMSFPGTSRPLSFRRIREAKARKRCIRKIEPEETFVSEKIA